MVAQIVIKHQECGEVWYEFMYRQYKLKNARQAARYFLRYVSRIYENSSEIVSIVGVYAGEVLYEDFTSDFIEGRL